MDAFLQQSDAEAADGAPAELDGMLDVQGDHALAAQQRTLAGLVTNEILLQFDLLEEMVRKSTNRLQTRICPDRLRIKGRLNPHNELVYPLVNKRMLLFADVIKIIELLFRVHALSISMKQ